MPVVSSKESCQKPQIRALVNRHLCRDLRWVVVSRCTAIEQSCWKLNHSRYGTAPPKPVWLLAFVYRFVSRHWSKSSLAICALLLKCHKFYSPVIDFDWYDSKGDYFANLRSFSKYVQMQDLMLRTYLISYDSYVIELAKYKISSYLLWSFTCRWRMDMLQYKHIHSLYCNHSLHCNYKIKKLQADLSRFNELKNGRLHRHKTISRLYHRYRLLGLIEFNATCEVIH